MSNEKIDDIGEAIEQTVTLIREAEKPDQAGEMLLKHLGMLLEARMREFNLDVFLGPQELRPGEVRYVNK